MSCMKIKSSKHLLLLTFIAQVNYHVTCTSAIFGIIIPGTENGRGFAINSP